MGELTVDAVQDRWWHPFDVPVGEQRHVRVGPCGLWFERRRHDWRITRDLGADALDPRLIMGATDVPLPQTPSGNQELYVERLVTGRPTAAVHVKPRLADRPVVVQTADHVTLLAGDSATLYVSTAVWVTATTGEPPVTMFDWPSYRASDTWFGETTQRGQLCYASRTSARLSLEEIEPLPGRCITPLRVHNHGDDALVLDRVRIPVPLLSVYCGSRALFTEQIELSREPDGNVTGVSIVEGPPADAGDAALISEPRTGPERTLLATAFGVLSS